MRESSSGNRPRSSSASRASRLRPSHRVSRMLVSSSPLVASTSSSTSKVALSRLTSTPVGVTGTTTRSATEAAVLKTSRSLGGVSTITTRPSPLFPSSSRACRSLSAATTSNGSSPAAAHSSALRSVSASSTTTSAPPLATVAKYTADVLLPTPPLRFTTATINAPSPPLLRGSQQHSPRVSLAVKLCSCEHVTLCSQTTVNTATCEESFPVNTACCEQSKQ